MTREIIYAIQAELRVTGHRYQIDLEPLSDESGRELLRALRDLDYEKRSAVNRARMQPWRR